MVEQLFTLIQMKAYAKKSQRKFPGQTGVCFLFWLHINECGMWNGLHTLLFRTAKLSRNVRVYLVLAPKIDTR